MEFDSIHGGEVGQDDCVGSVEIYQIFMAQSACFFATKPLEKVLKGTACMFDAAIGANGTQIME